jgi:hypothetical protein
VKGLGGSSIVTPNQWVKVLETRMLFTVYLALDLLAQVRGLDIAEELLLLKKIL